MKSRITSVATGILLLAAAVAKGNALRQPISEVRIENDWWLSLTAMGAEIVLGAWLISSVFPATARRVAIACFLGFSGLVVWKIARQDESCGCFGTITVDPRYILAVDVCVIAALCRYGAAPPVPVNRLTAAVLMGGIVVLSAGVALKVYSTATSLTRGLKLDETYHDFGDVAEGQSLTHTFRLSNYCSYPVELVRARSSCSCTVTRTDSGQLIPRGETLEIPVVLNTQGVDESSAGKIALYCRRAGTDDLPTYLTDVVVSAKVRPDYQVRPTLIDFGVRTGSESDTKIVLLRPINLPDVRVVEARSSNPNIRCRVLDERTREGDIQIAVTFAPTGEILRPQALQATVGIETTSTRRKSTKILARGDYRPPVLVDPVAVVVPSDAAGDVHRNIVVSGVDPLTVSDLTAGSPNCQASLTCESPNRWRVQLLLTETDGHVATEVRFKVHPRHSTEARVLRIPVYRFKPEPGR